MVLCDPVSVRFPGRWSVIGGLAFSRGRCAGRERDRSLMQKPLRAEILCREKDRTGRRRTTDKAPQPAGLDCTGSPAGLAECLHAGLWSSESGGQNVTTILLKTRMSRQGPWGQPGCCSFLDSAGLSAGFLGPAPGTSADGMVFFRGMRGCRERCVETQASARVSCSPAERPAGPRGLDPSRPDRKGAWGVPGFCGGSLSVRMPGPCGRDQGGTGFP